MIATIELPPDVDRGRRASGSAAAACSRGPARTRTRRAASAAADALRRRRSAARGRADARRVRRRARGAALPARARRLPRRRRRRRAAPRRIALWTADRATAEHVTSSLRADAFERLARPRRRRGDLGADDRAHRSRRASCPSIRTRDASSMPSGSRSHHEGAAGAALRGYFFAPRRHVRRAALGAARDARRAGARASRTTCSGCSYSDARATGRAPPTSSMRALALGLARRRRSRRTRRASSRSRRIAPAIGRASRRDRDAARARR